MKKSRMSMFAVLLLLLGVSMVWNSCRKDPDDPPVPSNFDEYVKALPYAFGAFDQEPQEVSAGSESELGYYCDTKEYEYSPGYPEVILFDPTTDVIAPGMFIQPGQSLTDGNYTPITNAKKPITLSRSTGESITIDNPSLATIRDGIQQLNTGAATGAAQIDYNYQSIQSKEELRLSMGAHYKNPWVELSAGLDWEENVERNFMYAKFVQVFYTIDVSKDGKNNPSDWFEEPYPDFDNWETSPVYVSSVKYGRIGIMTIESEATKTEMKAFMDAAIDVFSNEAEINLASEYADFLSKTDFKVMIIGGNPADAVASVVDGYEGFLSWIDESAEFSDDTPGSPVAYSLRYLKDNTPAAVVLSGSYTVKECYPLPEELTVTIGGDPILGPYYPTWDAATDDREFDGNGPMQNAYAELEIRENGDLQLNIFYEAFQWNGWTGPGTGYYPYDGGTPETAGSGLWEINLVQSGMIDNWPDGFGVKEIRSATSTVVDSLYFDASAGNVQTEPLGLDGLVNSFFFVGDTGGDDMVSDPNEHCSGITQCTNMRLELNPIIVTFEKK